MLKRVLHIYKDYYPSIVGGVERLLNTLCQGLMHRFSIRVLVNSRRLFSCVERQDGIEVIKVAELGRLLSTPLSPSFSLWLRHLKSDLYHIHSPNPMAEVSWLLARPKGKLVVTYHSDVVRQALTFTLYRPLFLRFLREAERIIVASPNIIEGSSILPEFRGKCVVIPWGVEMKRFQLTPSVKQEAATLRERYGPRLVLFVGRLTYFKGLPYLLEAMHAIDARLLVIGDGPLRRTLEAQVDRLGLDGKVIFLGSVSDETLTAYLHACDLLILPSSHRSEGFGIVQLEAQACGKPVISTELGTGTSFANLHQVTGLVVPPRDPQALVEAITRLLRDEDLRRRLGEAGKERVRTEFSSERMVEQVAALYEELLDGR